MLVISTNPDYPPFEFPADVAGDEFWVVGRLVVRWRESGYKW